MSARSTSVSAGHAGWRAALACALLLLAMAPAARAAIPAPYAALVVQPRIDGARYEFDLGPALDRARREHKNLYVYLGASDCHFCRRYETFLNQNATELVPRFAAHYLVVDLRSELAVTAARLFVRIGDKVRNYTEFQRDIGDERARMLLYPSVWLLDADTRPLMQMPAGTGTFETVAEQIEILELVQ